MANIGGSGDLAVVEAAETGGVAAAPVHDSSHSLRHFCFGSHQVYPAEPMQPWLSRSEPGIIAVVAAGDAAPPAERENWVFV